MSHLEAGVLHELLDGEIPSTELGAITAHLATCAECRARLAEERQLLTDVDGLVEELEVQSSPDRVVQPMQLAPRARVWPRYLAWAATVIMAAGLGYSGRKMPLAVVTRDTVFIRESAPQTLDRTASAQPDLKGRAESVGRTRETRAPLPVPSITSGAVRRDTATMDAAANAAKAVAGDPPAAAQATPTTPAPAGAPTMVAQGRGGGRGGAAEIPLNFRQSASRTSGAQELVARDARRRIADAPIDTITFPDAVQRLGGSLRLIEGMVPLRLEAQGSVVRVVYPASQGDLILQQQVVDGRIVSTLTGPRGFPQDSLARLRAKVNE